jgi:long-chain acyl-CoA synthetase
LIAAPRHRGEGLSRGTESRTIDYRQSIDRAEAVDSDAPVTQFPEEMVPMERIWLKSYPPGVPHDIKWDEYSSIGALVDECVKKYASRPAYVCMGKSITFAELDELSRQFGAWLQLIGLKKGDRVALMMPNLLQYPVAIFGVLRAGLTVVNTNPLYTPRELKHQLNDSGAVAIVVVENFANVVQEVVKDTQVKHVFTTGVGDMLGFPKRYIVNFVLKYVRKAVPEFSLPGAVNFVDAVNAGAGKKLPTIDIAPSDIAFLQYTGGTTGVSKGAMLTHGNLVANISSPRPGSSTNVRLKARKRSSRPAAVSHLRADRELPDLHEDRRLQPLIANPRDIPGFVKELGQASGDRGHRRQHAVQRPAQQRWVRQARFLDLNVTLAAAWPCRSTVADRWKKVTGKRLRGLRTDRNLAGGHDQPAEPQQFNGAIGLPISRPKFRSATITRHEVPMARSGEICIRGPQVMKGYWQRPDETAKVILADGFCAPATWRRWTRGYVFSSSIARRT